VTVDAREAGERVRRLRLATGLGQVAFAERLGIAAGSVSKLENGRMPITDGLLESVALALDCTPGFLAAPSPAFPTSRPWLRAYADASKRFVDRQVADCTTAIEVIDLLGLQTIPDTVPVFDGDLNDDLAIEQFAGDVRTAAQLGEGDVVGNSVRAAERLGVLVLPMQQELGRHLGMSARANLSPIICVSRSSQDPDHRIPGDRQRFTVAHELGHLALHSGLGPPHTAEEASRVEKQAHLFAGAFLAPGDALIDELAEHGGRVTLRTLALIKERWGIAIKALVMRFRSLGVIDPNQARSLYKQISARGWNKVEPVPVGNEEAIWFLRAIAKKYSPGPEGLASAAKSAGIGVSHLRRWTEWTLTDAGPGPARVIELQPRQHSSSVKPRGNASITELPVRRS
jgi:Zn-dependent peptidase ImmA (M78 family)/transcriptional regulator with XRE-family HTH domain